MAKKDTLNSNKCLAMSEHWCPPTWKQRSELVQWQMVDSQGLPLASLLAGQQGWGGLTGQTPGLLQELKLGQRLE